MNWNDLDYPPIAVNIAFAVSFLIGSALVGVTTMAVIIVGLWLAWVVIWNFIVKPRL